MGQQRKLAARDELPETGGILNASQGWVELTLSSYVLHSPPIARVEFSSSTDAPEFPVWGEFDDLSFTVPSATVPDVVGMTLPNAESSITAANLTTGTVSKQPSYTVATGDVISQSPAGNTVVIEGSAVNLTESCGAPVTVPLVVGMSATVAESDIVSAGLAVGTATYVRNSAPLGQSSALAP